MGNLLATLCSGGAAPAPDEGDEDPERVTDNDMQQLDTLESALPVGESEEAVRVATQALAAGMVMVGVLNAGGEDACTTDAAAPPLLDVDDAAAETAPVAEAMDIEAVVAPVVEEAVEAVDVSKLI